LGDDIVRDPLQLLGRKACVTFVLKPGHEKRKARIPDLENLVLGPDRSANSRRKVCDQLLDGRKTQARPDFRQLIDAENDQTHRLMRIGQDGSHASQ